MTRLFHHFARRGNAGPPPAPPANTAAPAVSGTPNYGQTLSVSNGSWTNSPTGYAYQWNRGGTAITGETAGTHLVVTADVGASLTCIVTASNAGGSASVGSNSVTGAAVVPDAVNNLAVASTTSSAAALTWSRPNANGSGITDYTVQYKLSTDATWSPFSDGVNSGTGATVSGLPLPGTSYDFRVFAVNTVGTGPASNVATAGTQAAAPSAVGDLTATHGSDGVSVNLTWSLPNTNGSALTAQKIERSPNGSTGWAIVTSALSGTATGYNDTGLTNATAYYYRHSSMNAAGTSATSNVANDMTAAPPAAVSTLATGTPAAYTMPLTWTAPAANGSAILDYTVQYKASTSSTWLTFADAVSATTGATVGSLLATTSYDFRVLAINGAGTGAASNVVTSATVTPFTSDANTYWWDFSSAPDILTNTSGTETIAYVRERVGGKTGLIQTLKDLQPLKVSAGADFNQATPRRLSLEDVTGITNSTTGWYFATNYKPTTGGDVLLSIGRNASSVASRGSIEFSSSRTPLVRLGNAEASSLTIIGQAAAQTLGVTMTLEVLLDTAGDTLSMWINGTAQTLSGTVPSMPTFPATDPISVSLGNAIGTPPPATSADGSQQQCIFYNGVPGSSARSSISTYLNSVRQT